MYQILSKAGMSKKKLKSLEGSKPAAFGVHHDIWEFIKNIWKFLTVLVNFLAIFVITWNFWFFHVNYCEVSEFFGICW